ncbi:MAG: enoyl-CoA hydratase-related protein [Rhodothermales bacterium]
MTQPAFWTRQGRVAVLSMNRPEQRNALSAKMATALMKCLDEIEADDAVRVVVLQGQGKAFCAGADLKALQGLQAASSEANLHDSAHLARLFERISVCPKPVIARVHYAAIGGGAGLTAAVDMAICTTTTRFAFSEVRLGFVPAIIMPYVLRKIGQTHARHVLLRGHRFHGEEAASIGLVMQAVREEDLDARVMEIAHDVADHASPTALALTKRLLADLPTMGQREAQQVALQTNAFSRTTADFKAGIASFLNKTTPPWRPDADG